MNSIQAKFTVLFLVMICNSFLRFGYAQTHRFKNFSSDDGYTGVGIPTFVQDSLGFLWIKAANGIYAYDGYSFKLYRGDAMDSLWLHFDNFSNTTIDPSGNLWGFDERLRVFNRDLDAFITYSPRADNSPGEASPGNGGILTVLFEKDKENVWLGTWGEGLCQFNLKTNALVKYPFKEQNAIGQILDRGSHYLLSTQQGLWRFDKKSKKLFRPKYNRPDSAHITHAGRIFQFKDHYWMTVVDPKQNWNISTLLKVDTNFAVLQKLDMSSEFKKFDHSNSYPTLQIEGMDLDRNGIFWIATMGLGLFRYDPSQNKVDNFRNDPHDPYSLPSDQLVSVMVDREQNVWLASMDKGISQLKKQSLYFYNYLRGTSTTDAGFLPAGNTGHLIAITQGKGIWTTPITSRSLASLKFQYFDTEKSASGFKNLTKIFVGKNTVWIGSYADGLLGLPINKQSRAIKHGPAILMQCGPDAPNKDYSNRLSSDHIWSIYEDSRNNLWVGTVSHGLNKVNVSIPYGDKGSVVHYQHDPRDSTSIAPIGYLESLHPENDSTLWIVINPGLDLFHYGHQPAGGKGFEHINKEIPGICVTKSRDGTIILGALNGLYEGREVAGRYQFTKVELLGDNLVNSVEEDKLGRLWIGSRNGLYCYNRIDKTILHFTERDGLASSRARVMQMPDGTMAATTPNGISLFDPMSLEVSRTNSKPLLLILKVNNKTAWANSKNEVDDFDLSHDISGLDDLTLDYRHNIFSLEFAALELTAPEKNLYKYKLEGFDKDWVYTNAKNRVSTYTNLDPGLYTFRVKSSSRDGIWNDRETTLTVVVLPPPWKTWWAYTGYGLLVAGLLFLARRTIVQRERLKSNLKLAQVEQEKEHFELEKAKEVDKVKSAFFTNISHEFRTPLTLIKGPVHDMLEEFADHPVVKERLKLVQRNADLLLKLINQLLDLAKLESGSLTVDRTKGDLNSFLSAVISSFSSLALQKDISLTTELPSTRYLAYFDKAKLETILINLINNAIKFTRAGGTVNVGVRTQKIDHEKNVDQLIVTVSDTGIGIPENQQTRIFERFYQVSEAHKEAGTGIGLSLVKELITLLGGTISLKSEPGKGSEFNVTVPLESIGIVTEVGQVTSTGKGTAAEQNASKAFLKEGELPRVLVVEDNRDLRNFIIESLGKEFYFLEAADGKQGMGVAFEEVPDLIISDIMMPELDGITMTGKLKKDTRTSHIPIILLTAKASDESKLSGLRTGADDYLTKPFNKNELLLKVRNSISLRIKLREKIRLELLKESPKVEVQSADEQFLWKVKQAIMARLGDEQLSVESLSAEIGLSRSQLFRKISSLTGVSVNELIRTFRLQKAAQLLEQNWGPVTQVAYEVGFSNLSYFSKVFMEQYGVLPSEYPVTKKHHEKISQQINENEIVDSESSETEEYSQVRSTNGKKEHIHKIESTNSDQQTTVLIVEDNADMRNYIRTSLSANYHIIEADNGKDGVRKAQETVPDLIISDVMMPEMDGYMLCENIKTKELTSHIPVILLTAKADRESKLTGLETGADDYLTKPFDMVELKLIVRNRIEQRRKICERFSQGITLEPKQISITSMDEKFLTKVLAIIETHMDDENFSIEDFSGEAGYSHIHFYRKIKALSGQSPSLFLRTIRLKRAADLLSKKSDNVSQIAYSVGFGSLSYFNKCFKEQFGITPGQFAASNKTTS